MSNFRRRLMCVQQHGGLPAEYQQVEYIESTGTQYIDTKLDVHNKTTEVTYLADAQFFLFGNVIIGCSYSSAYPYHCTLYNNKYYYGVNGFERSSGNSEYGVKHTIKYNTNNGALIVDDTIIDSYIFDSSQGAILYIGRRDVNNLLSKMKYYNIKIYEKTSGKIFIDFIPCYSTTTVTNAEGSLVPANTKGLYDLVEGKFYTNANTSEGAVDFIAGPDV